MNRLDIIADIRHLADESIADVYDQAAEHFQDGSIFVEIGCYFGGSTIYLAEQIVKHGKDIKIYAVDIFKNMIDIGTKSIDGSIFPYFWSNVANRSTKVQQLIRPVMIPSPVVANAFPDESVDFVYIDGDHSEQGIIKDLNAWYPKIKSTGWLGGHDYNQKVQEQVHLICEDEWGLEVESYDDGCRSFLIKNLNGGAL